MSGPIQPLDPTTPTIPDALWRQSGMPVMGWAVRAWIATIFIIVAWVLAGVTGNLGLWALAAGGVALFFLVPALVRSLLLARLAAKVDAVELEGNAEQGHALLEELRKNTTVKLLAPHGWLPVQEGRVLLALGDGRAAARAFGEAERVSTHPDKRELVSAHAHALVLAGDRKEARELLVELRKRDQLSALDHLNYGVVLLSEAGHNQEALAHLQQARASLGAHPRTLAALVLALQRCDKTNEATALLPEAEAAVEASGDQLAQDLLKRAKKSLRPLLKAKQKRERKGDRRAAPSEAAAPKPKGKRGRKQSRRDARKRAKAEAQRGGEGEQSLAALAASEAAVGSEQASRELGERETDLENDELADTKDEGTEDEGTEDEGTEDESSEDESSEDESSEDESSEDESPEDESPQDEAEKSERAEPPSAAEPSSAPAHVEAAAGSSITKSEGDDPEGEGLDLATLALEALGSGSRRQLDESEGGASASGLRPIEPSASSSGLFRSASVDEPKPGESPSLFSLPKFDSVPTFAPPKPTRGPVLSQPSEASASAKPPASEPAEPAVPPKLGGVPSAPSIPTPKPMSTPSVTAPVPTAAPKPSPEPTIAALDDGWGDLGELDLPAVPPPSPAGQDDSER